MARRPTQTTPTRKQLTPAELKRGIVLVERLIEPLTEMDPSKFTTRWPPEIDVMHKRIQDTLERIFGAESTQFERYSSAVSMYPPSLGFFVNPSRRPTLQDFLDEFIPRRQSALITLNEIKRSLEEELDDQPSAPEATSDQVRESSKKIFIVHGHDNEAKQTVARFVEKLGYQAVILHELASGGRTIIEKIEANKDVDFAVVLMTPDDTGSVKGGEARPRARQNVILELGYFMARLGRSHVFALQRGDIETPSDFAGVIYHVLDEPGAWKQDLAKEMVAAGLPVDWNRVMSA